MSEASPHLVSMPLGEHIREVKERNREGLVLQVASVTNDEGFVASAERFSKTVYSKDLTDYRVVPPGAFAYNPSRVNVGSIALLESATPVLVSPLYVVFSAGKALDGRYLLHFLKSPAGLLQIQANCRGSVRETLPLASLRRIRILIPPVAEQRRIAAILDKADAVRRKRQQILDLADQFLRSAFLDMFGDPGLPSATIGDLLAEGLLVVHKDGNHGSQYPRAEEFCDEGIPFLTAKSITDSGAIDDAHVQRLTDEKARQLKIGWLEDRDVLLAHNATVGRTALYRGEYREALIGTSLTAFRTDQSRLHPMYLLGALRSGRFQHQLFSVMSQTTRNQVPITAQRRLSIPIPGIDEQREYALLVGQAAHHLTLLERGLITVQALEDSLVQRAFIGEL